jgi:hypothetical protein
MPADIEMTILRRSGQTARIVETLKRGFLSIARRIYLERPSLIHLKVITEQGKLDEAVEADTSPMTRQADLCPLRTKSYQGEGLVLPESSVLYCHDHFAVFANPTRLCSDELMSKRMKEVLPCRL